MKSFIQNITMNFTHEQTTYLTSRVKLRYDSLCICATSFMWPWDGQMVCVTTHPTFSTVLIPLNFYLINESFLYFFIEYMKPFTKELITQLRLTFMLNFIIYLHSRHNRVHCRLFSIITFIKELNEMKIDD